MPASVLRISAVLVLSLVLAACRQETAPPEGGIVEANPSYLEAFGHPPKVQAGKAWARVGYLPLKKNPAMVGAIPLYIYEEKNQLSKILERLIGTDLILPPSSPLFRPFPPDMQLSVGPRIDKTVTLSLDFSPDVSVDLQPMLVALVETALQYEDVARVKVQVNGAPANGMPDDGWGHDDRRIAEAGSPSLVLVAGIWGEGEPEPEEIMVNFDRPVTVKSFQLSHADGRKVAGDYFTSVFQMSVVIHPKEPGIFKAGVPLHVEWEVVDALGRIGSGGGTVSLKKFVHEAHLNEFEKK